MKKLLIILSLWSFIVFPTMTFAASYYGCANAAINANSTFCDTPTGSCTGDNPQTAATALAGTHTLFANGCTITIPEALVMTATKLSNKDDGGAMVDGGQFTATTTGWTNTATHVTASIEAGGTTGACLVIAGTGNINPAFTLTSLTVTGGSASSIYGVQDTHTAGTVVLAITTITGGSSATGYGVTTAGATGTTTITGTSSTGGTGQGLYSSSTGKVVTYSGNCIGSDSAAVGGCHNVATGVFTLTGKIISGTKSVGATGNIYYTPAATDYILMPKTSGYTTGEAAGATAVEMPTDPTAAKVQSGTTYGRFTGSLAAGGGAWGF